jgi:hypothetical protein
LTFESSVSQAEAKRTGKGCQAAMEDY